jgi:hypothetical protein
MTRLFDDEQSSSLISSMMNPESNATKFMEQGEDIGLPRDVTMDILNKYATYGANTGIGNIGGERLVNALNEEYRKRVDAPLQEMPKEAFIGGLAEFLANLGSSAVEGIGNVGSNIADAFNSGGAEAAEVVSDAVPTDPQGVALNSPVTINELEQLSPSDRMIVEKVGLDAFQTEATGPKAQVEIPMGESVLATEQPGRLEKFKKYLEDNPEVARVLERSGTDVAKIIGQAIGGRDRDRGRTPFRAPRPRFQPSQVRTQRIGMAAGGKPEEGSVLNRKLFIQGGEVDGPGGPKEDLVPIWASDREYVVSEKGVRNMGGGDFEKGIAALDKINFGKS